MPQIPVRDMVGGQGVNYDQSPNDLPPNAFSEVINARFTRKRMERFGGTQVFDDSAGSTELANARFTKGIVIQGARGLLVVNSTEVHITFNGTSYQDVTPASGMADTTTWNLRQYGDHLLLTSLDTPPYVLAPGAANFVIFSDWPVTYQCQLMFAYKNILIAVGVEISNTQQNGLVKWSDVLDPGDVANVGWDPTDPTTIAGENPLAGDGGAILDAGVLKDSGILYTSKSVWRMDLSNTTAGITPVIFNFRQIFDDDGILSNRCFVEAQGNHIVVGVFDIYRFDGFNKISISDNRVTEYFYDRLGTNDFAFMEHYQRPQEIVIAYSVDTQTLASEALVYNYFYNTWTRWSWGDVGIFSHITQAPEFGLDIPTWADLQADGVRWSDLNSTSWNSLFPQNRDLTLYALGNDTLYLLDNGGAASSVTPAQLFIERRDLDLDEYFGGSQPIKYISKFLPIIVGEGTVQIQFGGRDALSRPIVWQPARNYVIGEDYKFDLRISTRYPAFRIIQDPADGTMALNGYDLIAHAESER